MVEVTCKPSGKKNHFILVINNLVIGVFERSELRIVIGAIDNAI